MIESDNERTTFSPSVTSLPSVAPVYTSKSHMYPLVESDMAHTLKLRFTGLRGKY